MTTEKQRSANRRNARKSTGPRSRDGKARAAQNARRHGQHVALPEEFVLRWVGLLGGDPADAPVTSADALTVATWRLALAEARLDQARLAESHARAALTRYLESKDLATPLDLDQVDTEALLCLIAFPDIDISKEALALLNARALPRLAALRGDLDRITRHRERADRERVRRFRTWRRAKRKAHRDKTTEHAETGRPPETLSPN